MDQSQLELQLSDLKTTLREIGKLVLTGQSDDLPLNQVLGWYAPGHTRQDLSKIAYQLAADTEYLDASKLYPEDLALLPEITKKLEFLQSNTIPEMSSQGNAGHAIAAYIFTLEFIRKKLFPLEAWSAISDKNALPTKLARRAQAELIKLEEAIPNIENIRKQLNEIQAAHSVADSLPVDLAALEDARKRMQRFESIASSNTLNTKTILEDAQTYIFTIKQFRDDAEKIIVRCDDAMKSATTLGLAGAFEERAKQLRDSSTLWVLGLIGALLGGAFIGATRFESLLKSLQTPATNWGLVVAEMFIAVLSVGAPLWFAWLSTKQISQRFKLSEDYAFKASVAKAYEGYRREAVRIDPLFERRLFDSALTRLDEAPLRFADAGSHGSPWHELLNSDLARQAIKIAPDLHSKVFELIKETLATVPKIGGKDKVVDTAPENSDKKE